MENIRYDSVSAQYVNIDKKEVTTDISTLFRDWKSDEKLIVMSPHDDDAIIGAGYAMLAAKKAGADVFVCIFCNGNAGYSRLEDKENIIECRRKEAYECYRRIGIAEDHIIRLEFPDFSAYGHMGWQLLDGQEGDMPRILRFLRENKITRMMVPNHYHEHIDHLAACLMSSYNAPQAGDAMRVDYGEPCQIRSVLQYSVWADLDPEDAFIHGRSSELRANRMIVVNKAAEEMIDEGIRAFGSQGLIIENLVNGRKNRVTEKGKYIEVYIDFDPRPVIDLNPYMEFMNGLDGDA